MAGSVGIDVGSTNVKAALLDGGGRQVASASRPTTWHHRGGVAEQDADELWDAVLGALADLHDAAGRAGHRGGLAGVGSVGVCGQYSSIVPVSADLEALAPMRLYLDQRGTGHCLAILERHDDAFARWVERHPVPPVGGGLALGHVLSFQLDEPDVHASTAAYLEPVDFVTARLTGEISATQGSVFAGQLVDNRVLGATGYDPELVERAGVDPIRLPPLVAPDAVVGSVRPEVATATGLTSSAVVRAGMTDTQAAALATGVSCGRGGWSAPTGRIGVAIGTTAVVLASTDGMRADFDHEVLSMPGVSPDRWLVWAENGLAGRAVEHVVDRLLGGGGEPFDGLEAALRGSPAGAGGLLFLPWLSGSMSPRADSTVRGGFVGMSLETERADLVRATVEGVAHNLRWLSVPVEAFTGSDVDEVVLVGGATRSAGWCQVLADVLGRRVRTVADGSHAGARAVGAWAADPGGAGPVADGPAPGQRWLDTHDPDPGSAAVHAATHVRFVAAFEALRPLRLGLPVT